MKRLTIKEGIVLGLVLGLTLALLWLLNGGSAAVLAQGPGPEIAVSPVFFDETSAWQEERTRTLTVANEGTGDLSFSVDVLQLVPSLLLHLDEPAGATTFYDASGNNNHGSCTGDSCPQAGVGGPYGTAVNFDGIDDYIAIPDNASFDAIEDSDRVTIAAWFNITDWHSGFFSLVDKYKPSWDFGWTVQIADTSGVQFVARPGQAGGDIWCDFVPNLGEWYHLAISYDRSEGQIRFFVNGDLTCESDFSAEIIDTEDGTLYLGYNPSGGDEYSNGTVDELVLYDRALSAQEIQSLYDSNWVGGDAVPWLSVAPTGGTVPEASATPIDVIFEASQVALPGTYQASLSVFGNAPYTPTVIVPVTITVGPGSHMGQLRGTVTSDWLGDPIEGALVEVLSGTTSVFSGRTDASGLYGPWWLPSGSYTVRVSADLHLDDVQSVEVSAGVTTTHDVVLTRNTQRIETRVATSSDDAEEFPGGYVHLTSTHLDLIYDDRMQTVGLRFVGLDIPQGARIVDAHVQFQVDRANSEVTSLLIKGEAADDAAPILNTNKNITWRTRTEASVIWSPAPWPTVGEAGPDQRTPNLAPVIQEIVGLPGWSSGNALLVIISGWDTRKRVAEPYDGLPSAAPLLVIEYELGPPVNQAPAVDAGPNQAVVLPNQATLDGTVSDDGLPDPPGAVTVEWSKVSGPGTATFADPHAEDTAASFSEVGEYVLRLTADDGELTAQDEVLINVQVEPVNQPPAVDAGEDQTVALPGEAALDGTVTDDGLPDPPGAVTVEWSKVSGPGTVTFADVGAEDTTASFSEAGEYVLRLTADDSELTASDEVIITVQAEPENQAPSVAAGADQTVVLPNEAVLDGTVTDDGLPDPPGAVVIEWSQESGPGPVTFADASVEDTTASFSEAGEYVLRLKADDSERVTIDEVTITVQEGGGTTVVEVRVAANSDDAEEFPSGYVHRTSPDLELIWDGRLQTVGLRFVGLEIPQGATIVGAYVQFQADETDTEAASLLVEGEAADDALTFTSVSQNITSRPRTGASVTWDPAPWTKVGEAGPDQRTADLTPVIQEIVNRPGWASGNALALIISGRDTRKRVAESYEGSQAGAPLLHIEYAMGPPVNQAPQVDAGQIQVIVHPDSASLDGTVRDDGLPNPPGAVTVEWSQVSGPGTTTFADASAVDTTATFSEVGVYTLRLTADDGELTGSDQTVVYVQPVPVNQAPSVDAGLEQTVVLPGEAVLDGTVSDDGLPDPPGAVTVAWSKVGGPGTVIFADAGVEDTTASFSEVGEYVLRLTADDGELSAGDEVTVTVQEVGETTIIEVRVSASSDDAEEFPGGYVHRTSTHLDLIYDGKVQTVGVRFVGVEIPQGATIVDAYVQFQVDKASSEATSLLVEGEAAGDAAPIVNISKNITSRTRTGASVGWVPVPWTTIGEAGPDQRTSNLAPVIQEIVSRSEWSSGNALLLIISGSGRRVAEPYDGLPSAAPLLHVEYSLN